MKPNTELKRTKGQMKRLLVDIITELQPAAKEIGCVLVLDHLHPNSSKPSVVLWKKVRRHSPQLISRVVDENKAGHCAEDIAIANRLSVKQVDNILYRYRPREKAKKITFGAPGLVVKFPKKHKAKREVMVHGRAVG